jgi:hypothetical protein
MFYTLSHKGKANKNDIDSMSTQAECLPSRKQTTTIAGENAEKKKPSHTVDGNINLSSHYGNQCGISSGGNKP